jgi:hypothetical protein
VTAGDLAVISGRFDETNTLHQHRSSMQSYERTKDCTGDHLRQTTNGNWRPAERISDAESLWLRALIPAIEDQEACGPAAVVKGVSVTAGARRFYRIFNPNGRKSAAKLAGRQPSVVSRAKIYN